MNPFLLFFLILILCPLCPQAQDDLSIADIRLTASFEHVSCHVNILGDQNRNSTMEIQFKNANASDYKLGAHCMRAYPTMVVDGSPLAMNFHAGSAMFLETNTTYDIKLILVDPDGGSITIDQAITTKKYTSLPLTSPTLVDNSDGPNAIQAALDNATPGDYILVNDGIYNPFEVLTDSVYIRSMNLHGAIIDGANTDRGVVTIGTFDDSSRYVSIDGFLLRNGRWGVDAQNTQFLNLVNCDITDVSYGIVNRRANGWEHDQYISNNRFSGRTMWPQSNGNIPGERGVDIRGNNNVVSFNTIEKFGDGVTTDGPLYRISYSLDIHHNDISKIVDDLIEVDGMVSNSRVYNNRAWNGRAGVSLAPVFGGPAYIFRNEFVNMENSTYKMNRSPAGLYIVHNTTIQEGNGMSSPSGWQSTFLKNNIVFAGRYCFEEFGLVSNSTDDWDYNAYYSSRAGSSGSPWFKWDNMRYDYVPDLEMGTPIESEGITIGLSDLVMVALPADPFQEVVTASLDLSLAATSLALDTGIVLPNINDPYVFDGKADLGFKEKDAPVIYGHDFQDICGQGSLSVMTWTGASSRSWTSPRNWSPCGVPIETTEVVIPPGLARYPLVEASYTIQKLDLGN